MTRIVLPCKLIATSLNLRWIIKQYIRTEQSLVSLVRSCELSKSNATAHVRACYPILNTRVWQTDDRAAGLPLRQRFFAGTHAVLRVPLRSTVLLVDRNGFCAHD